MKQKFNLLKSTKYIILGAFLIFSIVSLLLIGTVKINYNISDYLDDSTETKISLGIMEEEFGLISNIQVMINDITPDEAESVKDQLKTVENVIFVNFNSQSTDYYKDNSALFVVLVDGNEYSETAKEALAEISETLGEKYGERLELGGTVMEKKLLREAIQSEIVLILAISIVLVAVLMLITSASWIEPLVLLAASGIAVLLNMGTNAIFGEISYITNAIASILQLALSIDYSIVLLHAYRANKEHEKDNEHAMIGAIKEVLKPVSASALTTIAGLLALLFMSFTIGFDIGIVLMKSIVISAITSMTLLPALLLIFDGLMKKTSKKAAVIKGKVLCDLSLKAGKVIVPVAVVIIAICCVLNSQNTFNFVDSCNKNENITDKFGESGTLIVLYEKADDNDDNEVRLAEILASYKKEDGSPVLKSHVSYSSTIGQIYDVERASRDLGISERDAELLFTIYRFEEDRSIVKMNTEKFVNFVINLLENDEQAQDFVTEGTGEALELLVNLNSMLKEDFTAEEFDEKLDDLIKIFTKNGEQNNDLASLLENEELKRLLVNQIYGLYFFEEISPQAIELLDMLNFLSNSPLLPKELTPQIGELMTALDMLEDLNTKVDYLGFKSYLREMGLELPDYVLMFVWNGSLSKEVRIIDVLISIKGRYPDLFPAELLPIVNNYDNIYSAIHSAYEYDDLIPSLKTLAAKLGYEIDIEISSELVKHLYILYYAENNMIPGEKINFMNLLEFLRDTADELIENEELLNMVGLELSEEDKEKLSSLFNNIIVDANSLNEFLSNPKEYDYKELSSSISEFVSELRSMKVDVTVSTDAMMGVYVKYATQNDAVETGKISATDLLEFVLEASETNELLKASINEEMKKTIKESQENMISAEKLLVSDNYRRMLLTVNLPPESAESSDFVEYLLKQVKSTFGEDAYVAGEIATTNDLTKAFDTDNKMISIFTVVSIFIIITVVFRSISLPVILVAVIQGAIWISMSMTLIGGGSMFFMSYIMSMCILMGATIDYGILLSTNYVRNRTTMERREALYNALDSAMPTIFNSGLILMICGLVVGLIASQTSISSVGFLLFRGTLVSVVMITIVLPAILYMLDKIILKLTIKEKK